MKVIRMIEDSPVTGVKYGLVEKDENIVDLAAQRAQHRYNKVMQKKREIIKTRANNTKHK